MKIRHGVLLMLAATQGCIMVNRERTPSTTAISKAMAELGDDRRAAARDLGRDYEFGMNGVAKDPQQAIRWYLVAADAGDEQAQIGLANLYQVGVEGKYRDPKLAQYWLRRAAEKGSRPAQYRLASSYERGSFATEKDLVAAYRWYLVYGGKRELERLAKQLTPEQIREAEALAAGWRPTEVNDPR